VSGAAALLLRLHPTWTPEQIKSALVTTAVSVTTDKGPARLLDTGTGRIDLPRAAAVPVTFSPPSLSVPLPRRGRKPSATSVSLRVTNVTRAPVTLSVSSALVDGSPPLRIDPEVDSVSLAPGATAEVGVGVAIDRDAPRVPHTAVLLFTAAGTTLRVPLLSVPTAIPKPAAVLPRAS
jgi:minor extracellular serine protease Vpr